MNYLNQNNSLQVETVEIDKPQFLSLPSGRVKVGEMHYVRYPFADDSTSGLLVGTTRLETLPADVAVAVNPEDPRYSR